MSKWPTRALGDVCRVIGGGTPSKGRPAYYSGDIPWATVRDMHSEVISATECQITAAAVADSATNVIPRGNVVIATRVGLGKVCLLAQDTAINQDLRGIIPADPAALSVRFLYWWLKSIADTIVSEGTGATVQGVKLPFVKSLRLPLPARSEQDQIVSILDQASDGIATAKARAEKNWRNARAVWDGHLHSTFEERGDGWEDQPLGRVCEVKDGTHESPRYVTDGIPFVTQKNIREEGLSFDNTRFISPQDHEVYYRRSNVAGGDILISMIGANRGMACLVDDERTFSIKNVGLVKRNERLDRHFLLCFLKSPQAADYVRARSKGGAQEFIGLTELRAFPIPVPPLSCQETLAKRFMALREECQRLETVYGRKLAALGELEKSLLHEAFVGRLGAQAA